MNLEQQKTYGINQASPIITLNFNTPYSSFEEFNKKLFSKKLELEKQGINCHWHKPLPSGFLKKFNYEDMAQAHALAEDYGFILSNNGSTTIGTMFEIMNLEFKVITLLTAHVTKINAKHNLYESERLLLEKELIKLYDITNVYLRGVQINKSNN
jgi:hypothetical protein